MSFGKSSPLLRRALFVDLAASGVSSLALLAGAHPLAALTGLPAALLQEAGLALAAYSVFVAAVATRNSIADGPVWVIIVINAAWAVASIALLFSGAVAPTALGAGIVIVQAAAVA